MKFVGWRQVRVSYGRGTKLAHALLSQSILREEIQWYGPGV